LEGKKKDEGAEEVQFLSSASWGRPEGRHGRGMQRETVARLETTPSLPVTTLYDRFYHLILGKLSLDELFLSIRSSNMRPLLHLITASAGAYKLQLPKEGYRASSSLCSLLNELFIVYLQGQYQLSYIYP